MQVSPLEIENVLLAHPDKLISDAAVAGVLGGRTADEKIPRAWVVLTHAGVKAGEAAVVRALDAWSRVNLSKYKWLRGGIEVVDEVRRFAVWACKCGCFNLVSACLDTEISHWQSFA